MSCERRRDEPLPLQVGLGAGEHQERGAFVVAHVVEPEHRILVVLPVVFDEPHGGTAGPVVQQLVDVEPGDQRSVHIGHDVLAGELHGASGVDEAVERLQQHWPVERRRFAGQLVQPVRFQPHPRYPFGAHRSQSAWSNALRGESIPLRQRYTGCRLLPSAGGSRCASEPRHRFLGVTRVLFDLDNRERLMSHAVVINDVTFSWPAGRAIFTGLTCVIRTGRTGLIGANGTGKSTLLRLIAGDLRPATGSVRAAGPVGYLRQDLTLDAARPVDEVLGVARARRALRAIERGETAESLFAAVGDDWDVDDRARETLDRLGLAHVDLDRRVGDGVRRRGGAARPRGAVPAPSRGAAARRTDEQPRPACPGPALRRRRDLAGRAGGGQPRPRTARAGRPDR